MIRSYNELITINSFEDRIAYLMLNSKVGEFTFNSKRYFNQKFYKSYYWQHIKNKVIIRDNGCDLAHSDYPILGRSSIIVHHINPITYDDIINNNSNLFDMNNLVSTTINTHNIIHYGIDITDAIPTCLTRKKNDTCPWK